MSAGTPLDRFFVDASYYFIAAIFAAWCFAGVAYLQENRPALGRMRRWELAWPLGLGAMLALSVPAYYNVPTFEMTGLGVAKSMFLDRSILWRHDLIAPGEIETIPFLYLVDFKPHLLPFLLSLLHTFLGYKAAHVFTLNLFLATAFLTAVYVGVRRRAGKTLAVGTLFLVLSSPVFALCARTAASDLMSSVLLSLTLFLVYDLFRSPTEKKFAFLWMTLALLAYGREENPIYFIIIASFLVAFGLVTPAIGRKYWPMLAATPLFFAPLVWQRMLKMNVSTGEPLGTPLFGLDFFQRNLADFFRHQIPPAFDLPYDTFVHWTGVAALGWIFFQVYSKRGVWAGTPWRRTLAVWACCVGAFYTLIFCWWYPDLYTDPITVRFFLPMSWIFSLATAAYVIQRHPQGRAAKAFLTASVLLFVLHHPLAAEGKFIRGHFYCQETDFIRSELSKRDLSDTLIIMPQFSRLMDMEVPVIGPMSANRYSTHFLGQLRRGHYREILVVQRFLGPENKQLPKDALRPQVPLETLAEKRFSAGLVNRLARVILRREEDDR
jgi:hypothetical protein